jgi:hypothetical protein
MALSQALNDRRARKASAADRELALLILVMPQLLAQTTPLQRQVIIKRADMQGASWPEVAAALGMSRAQAWGLFKRAVARLPDTTPEPDQVMNPGLWEMAI